MATDCCGAEVPQTLVCSQFQAQPQDSLELITGHLESLMAEYARTPLATNVSSSTKAVLQTFKVKSKVDINMKDYMMRIQKYTKFEDPIFVAALILLEKAMSIVPELRNSDCIHK